MIDPAVQDILYDRMTAAKLKTSLPIPSQRLQLSDLPDEIIGHVFQFVEDVSDLINAACVSSRFKDLCEPYLYRHVEILDGERALRLSAAIKAKELRAKWIQSFLLSPPLGDDFCLKDIPRNLRKMRNLRWLRLETPDLNRQQPRARKPWIDLQERYERIFEWSSLQVSTPGDRELPFLTECTLHFVDHSTELYGLSNYCALFLHPNLRSLTISCASTDFPHEWLPDKPDDSFLQRQTNLQHLHLEECDFDALTLAKILRYPRALKSLKLSEGIRYTTMNSFHPRKHGDMRPGDLTLALSEQISSLEHLSLSLGYLRSRFSTINDHGEQLDLRDFTALRNLELCHRTLHLVRSAPECDHGLKRRLPSSLQKLVVFEIPTGRGRMPLTLNQERAYFPFHPCMFRSKDCGLPSLRQLILKYVFYGLEDEHEDMDEDLIQPAQILRVKDLLKAKARAFLPDIKKVGLALRIDLVSLPMGYIPPYLAREKKPQEVVWWDSSLEPQLVQSEAGGT